MHEFAAHEPGIARIKCADPECGDLVEIRIELIVRIPEQGISHIQAGVSRIDTQPIFDHILAKHGPSWEIEE